MRKIVFSLVVLCMSSICFGFGDRTCPDVDEEIEVLHSILDQAPKPCREQYTRKAVNMILEAEACIPEGAPRIHNTVYNKHTQTYANADRYGNRVEALPRCNRTQSHPKLEQPRHFWFSDSIG
jgi:hypothetical protein